MARGGLTKTERESLFRVIDTRITTRKPAPYLTNEAFIQGHSFYVDERVIVPRSYIGELLCTTGLSAAVPDPEAVTRVLDLCTGSGCLAILAALSFPNAEVVAVDLSEDALEVARRNVAEYGLADRVSLVKSDLFENVKGRFDVIISNPPYVTQSAVDGFPPEYKAEPVMAHLGGDDGLDLVRKIIAGAGKKLERGGALIVEVGQTREALEADYPRSSSSGSTRKRAKAKCLCSKQACFRATGCARDKFLEIIALPDVIESPVDFRPLSEQEHRSDNPSYRRLCIRRGGHVSCHSFSAPP